MLKRSQEMIQSLERKVTCQTKAAKEARKRKKMLKQPLAHPIIPSHAVGNSLPTVKVSSRFPEGLPQETMSISSPWLVEDAFPCNSLKVFSENEKFESLTRATDDFCAKNENKHLDTSPNDFNLTNGAQCVLGKCTPRAKAANWTRSSLLPLWNCWNELIIVTVISSHNGQH